MVGRRARPEHPRLRIVVDVLIKFRPSEHSQAGPHGILAPVICRRKPRAAAESTSVADVDSESFGRMLAIRKVDLVR